MTGKKIRRWAWEKAWEKQWLIIALVLVGSLPEILATRIGWGFSWPLKLGIETSLTVLARIFFMGILIVCLKIAQGEEAGVEQFLTPFSKEWIGKILLIVLVHLAVTAVLNYAAGVLADQGTEIIKGSGYVEALNAQIGISREIRTSYMKGVAIKGLGSVLRSIQECIFSIVWFPVNYLLFLSPKKTGRQVIQEGISLGVHSFWSIFKFQFWVILPGAVVIFFELWILFLLSETWVLGLVGIPLLYLFILCLVFALIADAGFALTLTGGRIKMPEKTKRK